LATAVLGRRGREPAARVPLLRAVPGTAAAALGPARLYDYNMTTTTTTTTTTINPAGKATAAAAQVE